ncbi:MAG: ABC transporter ATP-binding protein [Ilumatobacteraceae bacterium]
MAAGPQRPDEEALTMLTVRDLSVDYVQGGRTVRAVHDVSFDVPSGRAVALVGESGSGKSSIALAIMRLIPPHSGDVHGTSVTLDGRELLHLSRAGMRGVLRTQIGYVPQDPTTALDPLCTVGRHITETLSTGGRRQKRSLAVATLDQLGVPDAVHRLDSYPHEFSGGMRQRVAIAAALAKSPSLVIADEPTTALDVTTQLGIIRLLRRLQRERDQSLLFVTHNLAVARALCDEVIVLYGGRIVESGPMSDVLAAPQHPYTRALIGCVPNLRLRARRLVAIRGSSVSVGDDAVGCAFAPRCDEADERCQRQRPVLQPAGASNVACWRAS